MHSSGSITAKVEREFFISIPYSYPELARTGKKYTIHRLMLLGAEVPLFFGSVPEGSYERETSVWQPEAFGKKLPVEKRTEYWYPLETITVNISREYAVELARVKAEDEISSLVGAEIVSRTELLYEGESAVTLSMTVVSLEDIGVEKEIYVERQNWQ